MDLTCFIPILTSILTSKHHQSFSFWIPISQSHKQTHNYGFDLDKGWFGDGRREVGERGREEEESLESLGDDLNELSLWHLNCGKGSYLRRERGGCLIIEVGSLGLLVFELVSVWLLVGDCYVNVDIHN